MSTKNLLRRKIAGSSQETPNHASNLSIKPVRLSADQRPTKLARKKQSISRRRTGSYKLLKSSSEASFLKGQTPISSKAPKLQQELQNINPQKLRSAVAAAKRPTLKRRVANEASQLRKKVEERNSMLIEMFNKGGGCQVLTQIHQDLLRKGTGISRFTGKSPYININKFVISLKHVGIQSAEKLSQLLPSVIPTELFMKLYKKHSKAEEVLSTERNSHPRNSLKDLCMKMQLYKIPKNEMVKALFQENLNKYINLNQLIHILKNANFSIVEPEKLACFLMDNTQTLSFQDICNKILKHTEDWEIFTSKQEEIFDKKIERIIEDNYSELKNACQIHDMLNTGFLSNERMFGILNRLKIHISGQFYQYLLIVFYSFALDSEKVPYMQFLEAFFVSEMSDSDRVNAAKKYLELIADKINALGKKTDEVFNSREGLISSEDFVKGLKTIGITHLKETEITMLIDALQYEGSQKLCVHIRELKELLGFFGVDSPVKQCDTDSADSVIVRNDTSLENSSPHRLYDSILFK